VFGICTEELQSFEADGINCAPREVRGSAVGVGVSVEVFEEGGREGCYEGACGDGGAGVVKIGFAWGC